MFGGNNMSRCCRLVHLMTRTQHQQSWSTSGGRALSTVSGISQVKLRPWQQSTLSSSQWTMSQKTGTRIAASMSTANKPQPKPVPSSTEGSSNEVKAPGTGPRTGVYHSFHPNMRIERNHVGKGANISMIVYPERMVIYHAGTGSK